MQKNSGIIGPFKSNTVNSASGVFDTFDVFNLRKNNKWPKVKQITSVTPSSPASYNEGTSVLALVYTSGYEDGDTIGYTIETVSGSITSADFTDGLLSGTITVSGGSSGINKVLVFDGTSESNDVFYIAFRQGDSTGPIIATTANITINNPTFTITPTTSSFNEGSSVTFVVSTTNVTSGTVLFYSISGTGITASDFTSGSLTGSFVITTGSGSFTLTAVNDLTTEGNESFTASVRVGSTSGTIVATSSAVTLNDTSLTPSATITASADPINEGVTFTGTVNTTNFTSGTLYWTLEMTTGTLTSTDFSATSGSFSINSSTGTFSFNILSDGYTEGTEVITLKVRLNSTSGTVIGTLTNIDISDTSTGTAEPGTKNLSFYESRFGITIGTLNVYVVDSSGNIQGSAIYTASGNLNTTAWYLRETTYPPPLGNYRIAFHYVSGSSFTGDIALDLITIDGNQYSFESTGDGWISSSGVNTSSSTTALSNSQALSISTTGTLGKWNIDTGTTPSSNTGPSGAYSGTYYAYAETSSPNTPNINMWLFSPLLSP